MRKKVLAALVANEAPSATTLTEYDEEHLPTIVVSSRRRVMEPSGMKRLFSYSVLIPYVSRPERTVPGKVTLHARTGC